MTKCTTPTASFPRCKGHRVTVGFDGGEITSDGGALLLRQLDREMGLTRTNARRLYGANVLDFEFLSDNDLDTMREDIVKLLEMRKQFASGEQVVTYEDPNTETES